MAQELNFELPKRTGQIPGRPKALYVLAAIAIAAVAANIVLTATLIRAPAAIDGRQPGSLSARKQKDLALKLEKQNLTASAIQAWKDYIVRAEAGAEESATIWYRIGGLHQGAGEYEKALECYYRSESLAAVRELAPEIARKAQECLESLGKFAALRYELTERVGLDEKTRAAGVEVVADIGGQKITKAELDSRIEEQIERELSRFGASLTNEERDRRKQALLQRLSTSTERLRMLNDMVAIELLYRKAREMKLADEPRVKSMIGDAERGILADQVIRKEFADQIKITDGDLETYYEANKKEYCEPARAKISHILVKDEDSANKALKRLKNGEKFEVLAKELSTDQSTSAKGGDIEGWAIKGTPSVPGVGQSDEAASAIFSSADGQICTHAMKTDTGFHIIKVRDLEPERQRPFDDVRAEVQDALGNRKAREAQERLFESLRKQYDVVIHYSAFEKAKQVGSQDGNTKTK